MNKEKPLVSICCITYNHEDYICDAIEGFLMQEVDFCIEIIIHDDASCPCCGSDQPGVLVPLHRFPSHRKKI